MMWGTQAKSTSKEDRSEGEEYLGWIIYGGGLAIYINWIFPNQSPIHIGIANSHNGQALREEEEKDKIIRHIFS